MSDELLAKLAENAITTRDELAELAVDELVELTGVGEEDAKTLIMGARAHWFQ
jgi:N utilization substance protein A